MDGTGPEWIVNAPTGTAIADESGLDLGNGPVGIEPGILRLRTGFEEDHFFRNQKIDHAHVHARQDVMKDLHQWNDIT